LTYYYIVGEPLPAWVDRSMPEQSLYMVIYEGRDQCLSAASWELPPLSEGVRHYVTADYYESGQLESFEYFTERNELHREGDSPATASFYESGELACESYAKHGKTHRESGPAFIEYEKDGAVRSEDYYLNGEMQR
tara:strand:+ start:407 stop:814 length:408 start_codon:yes stop_codon:yes gene_type:complete